MPVAVKLGPYFSSTGEMALRLDAAGADALVLFNRFLQPDIDTETLTVVPGLALSRPVDALLPRTWIALLRGRVRCALAATTGVEDPADVVKYLLAGADVVMTASALLRHGPEHATVLLDGLSAWMARKGLTRSTSCAACCRYPRHRSGGRGARRVCHRAEGRQRQRLRSLVTGCSAQCFTRNRATRAECAAFPHQNQCVTPMSQHPDAAIVGSPGRPGTTKLSAPHCQGVGSQLAAHARVVAGVRSGAARHETVR